MEFNRTLSDEVLQIDGYPDLRAALNRERWWSDPEVEPLLRRPLLRACATYLTRPGGGLDAVARFHLGNGARLERLHWLGNDAARGIQESYGIMVNYLYDLPTIEANHEAFVRDGTVVRSPDVDALLAPPADDPTRKALGRKRPVSRNNGAKLRTPALSAIAAGGAFAALLAPAWPADARVTHTEIVRSEPAFAGQRFEPVGAYTRLTGRAYGEVAPFTALANSANAG